MPDTELLGILKKTSEVVKDQQLGRRFDSQTMEPTDDVNCKTNMWTNSRLDSNGIINNNPNISDYFRSSTKQRDRQRSKQTYYTNKMQ